MKRIVYFGTPLFAARVLRFLLEKEVEVVGVVTQPARPRGRSGMPLPSPVAEVAEQANLPVLAPPKASDPQFIAELEQLKGDLFIVVAYGQILRPAVLDMPPLGCFNLHASLLPHYRGAAPMQHCLMAGETETGVTIMSMSPEMDAGDMVRVVRTPIGPDTTFGELEDKLCELGMGALLEVIRELEQGPIKMIPQNHTQATFAPKLQPAELELNWSQSATELHNQIRGLSPRPGAWCWIEVDGKRRRLKVRRSQVVKSNTAGEGRLIVACGQAALELLEVQPEGKKPMTTADFLRGIGNRKITFTCKC